jgi:hypothetical protein
MAAIARSVRPVVRLLSQKQVSTSVYARGYAEMSFTFAAGNQVSMVTVLLGTFLEKCNLRLRTHQSNPTKMLQMQILCLTRFMLCDTGIVCKR